MSAQLRGFVSAAGVVAASALVASQGPVPGLRKDDPAALVLHGVVTAPVEFRGRRGTRIELIPPQQASGATRPRVPGVALLPNHTGDGVFATELAGERHGKDAANAPPTVGLVFHAAADLSAYEAVVVRFAERRPGERTAPTRPAGVIAYVSHPGRGRSVERPLAVDSGTWIRLRLDIRGTTMRAFVNDQAAAALTVETLDHGAIVGRLGFLVGEGTTAYFGGVRLLP